MLYGQVYRPTSLSYYVRFVRRDNGKIWDKVLGIVSLDTSRTDSAVALVEAAGGGIYPIVVPSGLPIGFYDIILYLQDGDSPANTDGLDNAFELRLGSTFGF